MSTEQDGDHAERMANVLSVLYADDQVVGTCAWGVNEGYGRPSALAGFFDPQHRVEMARAASKLSRIAAAVYFTLNPIDRALLARSYNKVKRAEPGDLTKDSDVLSRRWLMIDIDPVRAAGVSATETEKTA